MQTYLLLCGYASSFVSRPDRRGARRPRGAGGLTGDEVGATLVFTPTIAGRPGVDRGRIGGRPGGRAGALRASAADRSRVRHTARQRLSRLTRDGWDRARARRRPGRSGPPIRPPLRPARSSPPPRRARCRPRRRRRRRPSSAPGASAACATTCAWGSWACPTWASRRFSTCSPSRAPPRRTFHSARCGARACGGLRARRAAREGRPEATGALTRERRCAPSPPPAPAAPARTRVPPLADRSQRGALPRPR